MTQLSRLAHLGIIKEVTAGTYLAPNTYIPFTKADFEDVFTPIKDESIRANDSTLQGLYQGPVEAMWGIDLLGYPDLVGHFLRGIIGPDTVTAATSTTSSGSTIVGATTINTVATIAVNSYISIDTGTNLEYAQVTAVSGAGPFTLTVTGANGAAAGLLKAHSSGVTVVTTTTHTFKQSTAAGAKATYSLTVFDTVTGDTLGYPSAVFSDVQIKIDPKGAVSLTTKLKSFQGVTQALPTPTFTALQPLLGWEWTMTNGGATSTRGLTYDLTIKRAADAIHSSNGIQGPREVFQGALDADFQYKAIFENTLDMNLYTQYSQQPTTATLQQPVTAGGASLALTTSVSGYHKGKREFPAGSYTAAAYSASGIYNSTDAGSVSAVLKNYTTTQY